MSWNLYSILNNYGDFIALNSFVAPKEVLKDIEQYKDYWEKYNPNKPDIPRNSLTVTSLTGEMTNNSVSSLTEHSRTTGKSIEESDFNKPTDLYKNSKELQNLLDPWRPFLARTQIISLPPGGYFPPHIDGGKKQTPETFRLAMALTNTNPPGCCWMLGDDINYTALKWQYGRLYYVNTLKKHMLFNASNDDSIWLIINVVITEQSVDKVRALIS